jgi:hypothetical protein
MSNPVSSLAISRGKGEITEEKGAREKLFSRNQFFQPTVQIARLPATMHTHPFHASMLC